MDNKKYLTITLVVSVALVLVGLLLSFPQATGICAENDWVCISRFSTNAGEPLVLFFAFFIPSMLVVLVFRNIVYQTWKKLALVYLPLSALWIVFAPVTCGGFISFCLNKEKVSWLTAAIFLIITLLLTLTQKLKSKPKL